MTDTPKSDADKATPRSAEPAAPTKPGLPTVEELKRRGWKELKSSGKGYVLPLSGPLPKKPAA